MQRRSSLRRSFSWSLAGTVAYAASQAAVLVLLGKLATPGLLGRYALGLAICAPVFLLAGCQLETVLATDADGAVDFRDALGVRLLTSAVSAAGVALVSWGVGLAHDTVVVVALVGLSKGVEATGMVFQGEFQRHERMDRLAGSLLWKGAAAIAALALGLAVWHSLAVGLALQVAAWVLVVVFWDARSARGLLGSLAAIAPRWRPAQMRTLAWVALPLGVYSMLDSLNANLPRYFLQRHAGENMVGYYSAMAYLIVAGSTLSDALVVTSRPRLARHFGREMDEFRKMAARFAALAASVGVLGVALAYFAGGTILSLLYRPDYARNAPALVWLVVAATLWYPAGVLNGALAAARRYAVQTGVLAVTTAVTALGCALLVPRYGLVGAAWGLTAGMVARLILVTAALAAATADGHRRARAFAGDLAAPSTEAA